MTGRLTKVAIEAIKIGEEVVEHLTQGHHSGHLALERDAQRMARDVDEAEARAAGVVPQWNDPGVWSSGRPLMGENGVPGFDEEIHYRRGLFTRNAKRVKGFHFRPGGVEDGREHVLEETRIDHEKGVYEAYWVMLGDDGQPLRTPSGKVLGKRSTFWPDHWTEYDISNATAEAYIAARRLGPTADVIVGHGGGLRVKMFLHRERGTITSCFPYYDDLDADSGD